MADDAPVGKPASSRSNQVPVAEGASADYTLGNPDT